MGRFCFAILVCTACAPAAPAGQEEIPHDSVCATEPDASGACILRDQSPAEVQEP